jgi:hypothetical protein
MYSLESAIELVRLSRIFDFEFYREQVPDTLASEPEAISHYLVRGERQGLRPTILFDSGYYSQQVCVVPPGECLLVHYIRTGWAGGLRTHPLFDTAFYVAHNPDVVNVGVNPLGHFLASGGREGRRPHPLFHSYNYVQQVPGLNQSLENPLAHYLRQGWKDGIDPHPLFSGGFYLSYYPDVAQSEINPLLHFVTVGLAEGRLANHRFSATAFRQCGADPSRLTSEIPIAFACSQRREPNEDYSALSVEIDRRRARVPDGPDQSPVRLIAFYLPQFHPIPENDANWGEGFTEWTNVRKAKPNFLEHDQPRVPTDLGYYDLRDGVTLVKQAALAKNGGIHGFCFYWYWFNGRKPLEAPLRHMLDSGQPDFPFCFCWANEGWTRKWAGGEEVILGHVYSDEDDIAHVAELSRYMHDSRYIRIDGAPLLLIYRAGVLPNAPRYLERLRAIFAAAGLARMHIACVESAELAWANRDPKEFGCDSAVEFPPHGGIGAMDRPLTMLNPSFKGATFDYRETAVRYATAPKPTYSRSPSVMMGWDNTARYQDGSAIFANATPGGYQAWLEAAIQDAKTTRCGEERLVFINAWNEWGEGTYLEPDLRWGRGFLDATKQAIVGSGKP